MFRVPTEHARVFGVSVEAVAADVLPREEGEAVQQLDHLLHLMWGLGVWGLEIGVCGLRFGVWCLGFKVQGQSSGFESVEYLNV